VATLRSCHHASLVSRENRNGKIVVNEIQPRVQLIHSPPFAPGLDTVNASRELAYHPTIFSNDIRLHSSDLQVVLGCYRKFAISSACWGPVLGTGLFKLPMREEVTAPQEIVALDPGHIDQHLFRRMGKSDRVDPLSRSANSSARWLPLCLWFLCLGVVRDVREPSSEGRTEPFMLSRPGHQKKEIGNA
jgi:hypothetical protein